MSRPTSKQVSQKRGSGAKSTAKQRAEKSHEAGTKKEGKAIGRPSIFSEELAETFLSLVSEGLGLRKICERDDMPAMSTICLWLTKNEAFSERYARAKEVAAILMSEEILEIADNPDASRDTIETKFGPMPNKEWILRSKLRVDARFTLMEKLYPRKYGPKLDQKISGKVTTAHEVSEELKEEIIRSTESAASIAAAVQPPASFRGQDANG